MGEGSMARLEDGCSLESSTVARSPGVGPGGSERAGEARACRPGQSPAPDASSPRSPPASQRPSLTPQGALSTTLCIHSTFLAAFWEEMRTKHASHPLPAFPVYSSAFISEHELVLGGGGGQSKTGIKNKLVSPS